MDNLEETEIGETRCTETLVSIDGCGNVLLRDTTDDSLIILEREECFQLAWLLLKAWWKCPSAVECLRKNHNVRIGWTKLSDIRFRLFNFLG